MQIKLFFSFFILIGLLSCQEVKKDSVDTSFSDNDSVQIDDTYILRQGFWLGKLNISEGKYIPFNLEVIKDSVYFINAEEKIGSVVEKTELENLFLIKMPIFDSEFQFSINENNLFGFWLNKAKGENYKIDFSAQKQENNTSRFAVIKQETNAYFEGKWETVFSPGSEESYNALGLFSQSGQSITGTFLTETGDYRFLQGNVSGDSLYLSCFDGSHAFLFAAKLENDSLFGMFYSGTHWQEPWTARLNETFELRDPFSITEVVNGQTLEFSLPDLEGNMVNYPDPRYTEKVVIIQLLGSWCPNCMDETAFLTQLYDSYHAQGLEIIGLSFEVPESLEDKTKRVRELKDHFQANYEFLIGGKADKHEAEKLLPILNNVVSFPTTIFIDRDGVIRKIHTGFYGPGTGKYYLEYVNQMQSFIQKLLNE